ncbi:D-3-phosphoglycerate dehydrogenase [Roseibium hamelinense]|uniref:D-3-phosphoglycerate dehydrogenase n=1 Tax=Roseibium hamelinense TaxID=150831 RepID=A0A562SMR5_9HYPH|nr:phosphoglycerate dehydrogenase [Roseibium hamelinense]MTI44953.1 phosphoglycerate dehydrogenase [Roseibium hamelinense]TWI82214.1 D-3-phosphoglycerate dehydrogenase [Roseibium hamelinense]
MAPKVLISDKLSEAAVNTFKDRGIDVDFQSNLGKDKEALLAAIGHYDGLAIRSTTKVTEKVIAAADRLRVIGRAGIGVDNVDIANATERGIIVMNTPFGNAITTAEHALAMMFSVARQIPAADASTQAGKWEKSRFMGTEVTGKTLGLVGCGNIGSIVADRALGLRMKVIAFDPFLTPERAKALGVEKVELEQLLPRADFITLHTPLTDKTRNIIDADALSKMKRGAFLINCARGGLADETAVRAALDSGTLGGAAFDVFVDEPTKDNVLFGGLNFVSTPHLGASTKEAQENVALQVAEQMCDYLLNGAVTNALNMPSISADEAPKLTPYVKLAEQLGSFAGQLTETAIEGIRLEYAGVVAEMNTNALTAAALTGLLTPLLQTVNMVSAPSLAKNRGIEVEEIKRAQKGAYETYIRLTVLTERQERSVAGTVFADGKPRIIQVKGINMEAELGPHMLYITNEDKPGFIGHLGTELGNHEVNIATFNLGRMTAGGDAICLVEIDEPVSREVMDRLAAVSHVKQVKSLAF